MQGTYHMTRSSIEGHSVQLLGVLPGKSGFKFNLKKVSEVSVYFFHYNNKCLEILLL